MSALEPQRRSASRTRARLLGGAAWAQASTASGARSVGEDAHPGRVPLSGHRVAGRPQRPCGPRRGEDRVADPADGVVAVYRRGQFLGGEATSEVGLKAGARKDFWVAVQPDAGWLNGLIAKGNKLPPRLAGLALRAMAASYVKNTPPRASA